MKKILLIMIIISSVLLVGCNGNSISQDKELCTMKGFEYHTSSNNDFVQCLDNGVLVKVHYTEYFIMKNLQRNEVDCKETYIEHLVKVGDDKSFELTKCKENGLTIDVREVLH